jgi:hypothetical protein
MATIEVRANQLTGDVDGFKEPSHLVIVVTDDAGRSTYFRGGPGVNREDLLGVSAENPWGQVITDSGPFVPDGQDWKPGAAVIYRETIPQSEVQSVISQFKSQLDAVQAARYVYDPLPNGRGDGNSNSVVGTLMRNVRGHDLNISNWATGIGNGVTAPGENIQLVDREGRRVFRETNRSDASPTTGSSIASNVDTSDKSPQPEKNAVLFGSAAANFSAPTNQSSNSNPSVLPANQTNRQQASQPNNSSRASDLAERQQTYNEYAQFVRPALAPNATDESLHRAMSYTLAQEGYPPQYRAEVILAGMSDTGLSPEKDIAYAREIATWPEQRQMPQSEPVVASAQLER